MSIANTKGVDIFYWNGDIDLSKVKNAGYKWVMIRCGYGSNQTGISFTRMGLQPHAIQRFGTDMFDVLYNLVLPLIHRNLAG